MENIIKGSMAFGGAAVSYMYGGWSALLVILIVFTVLDYATGVLASGLEGKLSSKVGIKGIAKKIYIFVMVAAANLVDMTLGTDTFFRDAAIFFYIANELISIIENGGRIGVPIPPVIKQAVEVLQSKGETKS